MKILITGARGMLGTALTPRLAPDHDLVLTDLPAPDAVTPPGPPFLPMDITDHAATREVIARAAPDVVIHAAAMTQVDRCEGEADLAHRVNAIGSRNVALAAESAGAAVLYVGTDFIFDGTATGPIREYDAPRPLSVYGASKLAGELAVREFARRHYGVRTAWLYGAGGPNFVETILRAADAGRPLRVVDDQVGSPTWTHDLAGAIAALVATGLYGIYHVTNAGSCSWHEYALAILAATGRGHVPVAAIRGADWGAPAARPAYSVLSDFAWRASGFAPMRPWPEALAAYLATR